MERYSLNSWLNVNTSEKAVEKSAEELSKTEAPLVSSGIKKRVITKVVTRIQVEKEETDKPFGKIEAMFKKAHTIKELEEIASGVNSKALIVSERSLSLFDYIKKLGNAIMQVFIES